MNKIFLQGTALVGLMMITLQNSHAETLEQCCIRIHQADNFVNIPSTGWINHFCKTECKEKPTITPVCRACLDNHIKTKICKAQDVLELLKQYDCKQAK
jgi:hypothetical protein